MNWFNTDLFSVRMKNMGVCGLLRFCQMQNKAVSLAAVSFRPALLLCQTLSGAFRRSLRAAFDLSDLSFD